VRRRPYPADGRRVLLSLTPKARQLMGSLFPEFNRHEIQAVSTLDGEEREVLTRALRKIVHHLEVEAEQDPAGAHRQVAADQAAIDQATSSDRLARPIQ